MKEGMISHDNPSYCEPIGLGFIISVYVDSGHAGDSVTRHCSRTGYIALLNNTPIYTSSLRSKLEF